MKKKFTIAEFLIILLALVNICNMISSFLMIKDNSIYIYLGISYLIQAISLSILYIKKKDIFFYIYCVSYIFNLILAIINQTNIKSVTIIGYIIGTMINLYITFIAKKSIQKKEKK